MCWGQQADLAASCRRQHGPSDGCAIPHLIADGAHPHANQVGKESGLVAVDQLFREEAEQAGGLEHTMSGGGDEGVDLGESKPKALYSLGIRGRMTVGLYGVD